MTVCGLKAEWAVYSASHLLISPWVLPQTGYDRRHLGNLLLLLKGSYRDHWINRLQRNGSIHLSLWPLLDLLPPPSVIYKLGRTRRLAPVVFLLGWRLHIKLKGKQSEPPCVQPWCNVAVRERKRWRGGVNDTDSFFPPLHCFFFFFLCLPLLTFSRRKM